MKTLQLGTSGLDVAAISLGCMRIAGMADAPVDALLRSAMDTGMNFFDHADVYGGGQSEEVFARSAARLGLKRADMVLQSKCGIRKGQFDFSKENILNAVNGSLKRLQTDHLDVLLLHRPDTLVEPEEVAEAFSSLQTSGKVKLFGVSNQHPNQIEFLQASLPMKLQANQLQLSITNTGMMDQGFNVNMQINHSVDRDGGILDYCRLKKITIQAWSPFQYGFFEGVFLGSPKYPELNAVIDTLSAQYGISPTGMAIAWILRHPAKMQAIIGTTSPERVKLVAAASQVVLSREHWYEIYRAAGNKLP